MHKQIDFSNIGGFPLEQDTLAFMQDSYTTALMHIARLCGGDKIILWGVEVEDGVVSDGAISINNEIIPFAGGAVDNYISIEITQGPALYEDGNVKYPYTTKIATCAAVGDIAMAELQRLPTLINIWLPGDIKMKYVPEEYIAANFDANGYGLNREKGWRILSKQYPATAGRVFVQRDPSNPKFNEVGKIFGAETHPLTADENGQHVHQIKGRPNGTGNGSDASLLNSGTAATWVTESSGLGLPHNNIQPSVAVLVLIRL
jgi:hypothetical protein